VSGRINQFPTVGIKLKGAEIPTNTWPSVVQLIDSQVLTEKLGYEIASFQLELEPESQEGYKREWKINTAIPPEKHLGYAVQWFGLALTLTALFFWISLKKRSEYSA
jgi:surfeit locus 1 family protein